MSKIENEVEVVAQVATEIKVDKRKGFKLGHVWLSHVNAGIGIALIPNNFAKLKQTAAAFDIKFKDDVTQPALIELLKGKIPAERLVASTKTA